MSYDGDHFLFVFSLSVFLLIVSVLSLYWGGGGKAEAALSDVQLSRITGPDILRQLWHTRRLPAMASTGIKSKQETKSACYCVCSKLWHSMCLQCFLSVAVCFSVVPLGLYLNQRLDVGTTIAFCLLSRPIRNCLSECVWLAPRRQTLSGVWLWLNSIPLFT